MKDKLVFLDVETDGLYGAFLTVAMIATDGKGNELERAYYGIKREIMQVTEPWVQENVIPKLGDYEECNTETELLQKAWDFWMKYQKEAYAVCDVGFPVEAGFLRACVALNEKEAMWKAPFPLVDLSSLLLAKGYDPLVERKELVPEFEKDKEHSALYDVEVTVKVWKKLMVQEERQTEETA